MTGHPQIRAEATIQLLFPYASLRLFAESAKAELQWEGRKARGLNWQKVSMRNHLSMHRQDLHLTHANCKIKPFQIKLSVSKKSKIWE